MTDGISSVCDVVRRLGVDTVFGLPGTQTVSLFEALRRSRIRTVLATSELSAAFMACGFFRASGRMAAVSAIAGPGLTSTLSGLAEARLDSTPILVLSTLPASAPGRRFQLQAIDQAAVAAPLCKAVLELRGSADVARVLRHAVRVATTGEPGPVLVQLDLTSLGRTGSAHPAVIDDEAPDSEPAGLDELRTRYDAAKRPLLVVGMGAAASAARIRRIVDTNRVPVITTPSARGVLPEDHPLAMGFDPVRGDIAVVNGLIESADLIVGLGCKLGHNGSGGFQLRLPPDRFAHIDAEPAVLGANYAARWLLEATVERALPALECRQTTSEWAAEPDQVRVRSRAASGGEIEPRIHGIGRGSPVEFFSWLRTAMPRDALLVTDSGLHQVLARRHFEVLAPRGLIIPSDFQSMGFGIPAAVGACVAERDRAVVAIVGDGGFMMSGFELLTARREAASLVVFVFNDGYLNQIRVQQLAEHGHSHAVDVEAPDYAELSRAFGLDYYEYGPSTIDAIAASIRTGRMALVEVVVGDSARLRRVVPVARARGMARRLLAGPLWAWLKTAVKSREQPPPGSSEAT